MQKRDEVVSKTDSLAVKGAFNNKGSIDKSVFVRPKYENINEVLKDKGLRRWWSSNSDYPMFWFSIAKDTMDIQFTGQCYYSFPCKIKNEKMVVYWDTIGDCNINMGINNTFELNKYPAKGNPFMILELVSDTALKVNYLYPKWVSAFNKKTKYTMFPDTVYSISFNE